MGISSLFQTVVLAVAAVVHGQSLLLALGTVLVLVPMNVLVFALDNLIFLLIRIVCSRKEWKYFLRTMLTFTGKGLLFVLGLGLISTWGMAAVLLAKTLSSQLGTAPMATPSSRLDSYSGCVDLPGAGSLWLWARIPATESDRRPSPLMLQGLAPILQVK